MPRPKQPRVFVSYAWEDEGYKTWVRSLAKRLRQDGVRARLDAWHLGGRPFGDFMSHEVEVADWVLLVCSPEYREKVRFMQSGERPTGSGWELSLLTSAILDEEAPKVALALGRGDRKRSIPFPFKGRVCHDLTNAATLEESYRSLLQELLDAQEKPPPLGPPRTDLKDPEIAPMQGPAPVAAGTGAIPTIARPGLRPSPPARTRPLRIRESANLFEIGRNRIVRVEDGASGALLGPGFRLGPEAVLTAGSSTGVSPLGVGDPEGSGFRRGPAEVLWCEDQSGPALLSAPRLDSLRAYEPLVLGEVPEGRAWRAFALSLAEETSPEPWVLTGEIGPRDGDGYQLRLHPSLAAEAGLESLWPWAGAGILVQQGSAWALLGVLTVVGTAEGWACRALTLECLKASWGGFASLFPGQDAETWCRGYRERVASRLERPEVRVPILDHDPDGSWKKAYAGGTEALARALCQETEPHVLAEALKKAYESVASGQELASATEPNAAEEIYAIATEAVPSSLFNHWPLELPGGTSATDVELELLYLELVELLLAASDATEACYVEGSETLSSVFFVSEPGESGADPTGERRAVQQALAALIRLQVVLGTAGPTGDRDHQERLHEVLAGVATHTVGRSTALRPEDLTAIQGASVEPDEGWTEAVLDILNTNLGKLAKDKGRRLWVLRDRDQAVAESLRKLLPELQIVSLRGHPRGLKDQSQLAKELAELQASRYHYLQGKS